MALTVQLRRVVVSVFVILHLTALAVWNLPGGPIHERFQGIMAWYLFPTGLAQHWNMFAPDPRKASFRLEGMVIDRNGITHRFAFPCVGDGGIAAGFWRYRHAKYTSVVGQPQAAAEREYAARTIVRRLNLPPTAFPVDVQLQYQVRTIPPPGTDRDDLPLVEPPAVLGFYRFPTREEAQP